MTVIVLSAKKTVSPFVFDLYLAVKVFEPAVTVIPCALEALCALVAAVVDWISIKAVVSLAALVVVPETAKSIKAGLPEPLSSSIAALTITKTFVPVVKVTAGPLVVKFVYVVDEVDCLVDTLAKLLAGDELAGVAHFKPVAVEESAVRTVSFAPTVNTAASLVALPATRSPLAAGAIELAVALVIAISYLLVGFLLLLL
jgi:hypothetical protein